MRWGNRTRILEITRNQINYLFVDANNMVKDIARGVKRTGIFITKSHAQRLSSFFIL